MRCETGVSPESKVDTHFDSSYERRSIVETRVSLQTVTTRETTHLKENHGTVPVFLGIPCSKVGQGWGDHIVFQIWARKQRSPRVSLGL